MPCAAQSAARSVPVGVPKTRSKSAARSGAPCSSVVKMPPPSSLTTTRVRSGTGSSGPTRRPFASWRKVRSPSRAYAGRPGCASAAPTRGRHDAVDPGQATVGEDLAGDRSGGGEVEVAHRVGGADDEERRRSGSAVATASATASPVDHGNCCAATAFATAQPAACHCSAHSPRTAASPAVAGASADAGCTAAATCDGSGHWRALGHHLDPHAGPSQERPDRTGQGDPADDDDALGLVGVEPVGGGEDERSVRQGGGPDRPCARTAPPRPGARARRPTRRRPRRGAGHGCARRARGCARRPGASSRTGCRPVHPTAGRPRDHPRPAVGTAVEAVGPLGSSDADGRGPTARAARR